MTMQRYNRRRNRQAQFTQRILQPEHLETRMLLAGDMVASWQNPVDCNDVNQDGLVTPIDALSVINAMNTRGIGAMPERAAGEPGSTSNVALIDVNGDGILSAVDASLVINALNGEGEGEIAQFRLEVLDTSENPISTIEVGESFLLRVSAQDLRAAEEATGLFAAYTDVEYDASLVTVAANGAIQFTPEFPNGTAGDTSVPGLIDEGGAFINAFSGFGTEEKTLFTVEMTATSAGTVTFSSNPADVFPNHDTFFFGTNEPIAAADVLYDSTTLTIGAATPQIDDLVAFAEQLDSAGVQFWSTRQFSTDAVAQRDLFSDGQEHLPFNEIFDANGDVNAAAQAAGVSQVNTWIFPNDSSMSEGVVLSVADIATRSGVAIPSKANPFLAELPDVTITSESPLHVPLNGFDPEGNPLTYTVTSDNPSLLDTTVLTGNRSWELDVEGYGTMTFEFYEQRASRATDQFIQLTEDGFYDGIKFHRIIDGFVIQGGDPTATGSGGSDLPNFDDHFNVELQHNRPGVLSMAKTTDDTNNSQFFVTEVPTRHLDFNHTIFGQLTEGEQTFFALTDVLTGARDVPIQDAVITEARVVTDTENGVLLLKTDATSGSGTVTVTATDQFGNETSREFVVNVEPDTVNTNPFLDDIAEDFSAMAGTTFEFQLGYTDIENDDVSFFASPVSAGATASVDDNGLVSVGIPSNVAPGEVVVVDVTVAQAAADTQRVEILVEGVAPTLTADSFTISEDSTGNQLDVLANDGLEDSATIVSVGGADINGVATISADGKTIDYAPTADFFGEATFTYNVQTSSGIVAGVATVTVENVLDPPVARDDFFPEDFPSNSPFIAMLVEDSTAQVTLPALNNDLTVDGTLQELTLFDSATDPQFGTLDFSVVAIRYTPAPDFFGIDTFTYTTRGVTSDLTSTATVTINVPEVNDPPLAADDSVSVPSGGLSVIAAADLLSNDSAGPANESDQTLTITSVSTDGTGTVAVNADGDIEYTPADGFTGTETIMYAVTDNGTSRGVDAPLTAIASVTVDVTGESPVRNDEFTIPFGSDTVSFDVLANDTNPETLDLISVAGAVNGSASVTDGPFRVTYTPDAGFFGTENLTYTVQTSDSETFTGNLVIQVQTAPPTAVDDSFTFSGTTLLNVLPNDQLGAGATSLAVDSVASPANGTATIVSAGAGIEYQPDAGFSGQDQFTYTVIDNTGQTSSATITVTVESSVTDNNPPIAINDDLIVDTDAGAQTLDVLANDVTLPDTNETLTIINVTVQPTNGTATINTDGTLILYTPSAGFEGLDALTYEISDGNGGTATASVDITVGLPNALPTALDDDFSVTRPGTQSYDVLSNDSTEAGETLSIVEISTQPTNGTATINGTRIDYTPDANFTGTDSLQYVIDDGNGGDATATVTFDVAIPTDTVLGVNDSFTVVSPGVQTLDVLANDIGDSLRITSVTATTGTATINADGDRILFTPDSNSPGLQQFTYTVEDGNGQTSIAEASVTFSPVTDESFVSGTMFSDVNRDGIRNNGETALGGVSVRLSGMDSTGNEVDFTTTTDLSGDFRIEGIGPGSYTVSQGQPTFLIEGPNVFGVEVSQSDDLEIEVSDQLIASSDNTFTERGLLPQFAMLEALSSFRSSGLLVVLDGDGLEWLQDRGGWDDLQTVSITRDGNSLSIVGTDATGTQSTDISMSDRSKVQVIGRSGSSMMLRILGTSSDILSPAAVDAALAQ